MNKIDKFTPTKPLNTAVLFLIFNRLETTKQVFQKIRIAKPPRLYIASDGARANKKGEDTEIELVRKYVLENIDWDCQIKTLFRDQNLGCKYAVSSGISWFFEYEENGIILEDDCLPSISFFWYCEYLLNKYDDDLRVWHISGDNFLNHQFNIAESYYFSKFCHIWGWATWANRWNSYDVKIESYPLLKKRNLMKSIFIHNKDNKYWLRIFEQIYNNKIDTWDYQWVYTIFINNGLCINPSVNLISNIGFGTDATHTKNTESIYANIDINEFLDFNNHPKFIISNHLADNYTKSKMFRSENILVILIKNIIKYIMK